MSTPVTIHGSRFKAPGFAAPSAVHIGPSNGPSNVSNLIVVSDKIMTCELPDRDPSWPPYVHLWITTPYGVSVRRNAFHYKPDPPFVVLSISPTSGHHNGGTAVTILGHKFTTAVAVVWDVFGVELPAAFVVDSDNQITATSPGGTQFAPYGIKVKLANGQVFAFKCNDAAHPAWQFTGDPVIEIDSITPNHGSWLGGYTITVKGRGFLSIGITHVDYLALTSADGTLVIVDDETATFTALASADMFFGPYDSSGGGPIGLVPIYFSQPGGEYIATIGFQLDKLSVTSASPNEVPVSGGTTVVLEGTALDTLTEVHVWDDVNGVDHDASASIVLIDAQHASFVMPVLADNAGTVRVQIVGTDPGIGAVEGSADPFFTIYAHLWRTDIATLPGV